MHRPDTMIEIHRERVQDQTVEVSSGDKYTESVDGGGNELCIDVIMAPDGSRRLIVDRKESDMLQRLPRCGAAADDGGYG
jgi:hypothetical protein